MIGIINYGVGNISAFVNIYKQLNIPLKIVSRESDLLDVSKIILPGVGHFDYAMTKFQASGMKDLIDKMVTIDKVPVIGICVGMQMMARRSDEGVLDGLGWIDADVKRFDADTYYRNMALPLPHMGWNDVYTVKSSPLLKHLEEDAKFYFLHSYYFVCHNQDNIVATAEYGAKFTCISNHGNVYGIQCHPEKSHKYGVQLLKNFAELC